MRALPFILLIGASQGVVAQTTAQMQFADAGLSVVLPPGFAVRSAGPMHAPGVGVYTFEDTARTAILFVELHTYLSAEARAGWAAGDQAQPAYDHMERVEPVDVALLGAEGTAAFEVEGNAGERLRGYVVYGCAAERCFKIEALGLAAAFPENDTMLREAVAGVRVEG